MKRELSCFGIAALDELVGPGIPRGSVINITGPPGTGKTNISLSFISGGLESGEAVLHVSFTSVPLVNIIKDLKDIERLRPLFSTDEPMIMDLLDLRRSELLIGIIKDGSLDRLVLDHPEAMAFRNAGSWFAMLEELLGVARSHGVTTLLVDYDRGPQSGVGMYVSDGIVSLFREGGRTAARIDKWDMDPELVGRVVREEVPGAWRK
ncbi:MAG: hypothetical protein JW939_09720 [Candidatus Thermoplasmatota archaeon]|nr:hypothetical protein [Candidatus Thermoplasmatota archaeon]